MVEQFISNHGQGIDFLTNFGFVFPIKYIEKIQKQSTKRRVIISLKKRSILLFLKVSA